MAGHWRERCDFRVNHFCGDARTALPIAVVQLRLLYRHSHSYNPADVHNIQGTELHMHFGT